MEEKPVKTEESELTDAEKELLNLIISHILNQILPCLQ